MSKKYFVDKLSIEDIAEMTDKMLKFEKMQKNKREKISLLKLIPAVAAIVLVIGVVNMLPFLIDDSIMLHRTETEVPEYTTPESTEPNPDFIEDIIHINEAVEQYAINLSERFGEVVWWTYGEYKAWIDELKHEKSDEELAVYETVLADIRNGWKISKTVDGNNDFVITIRYDDNLSAALINYSYKAVFTFDGSEVSMGFAEITYEGLIRLVKDYCDRQVTEGKMTQAEADSLISEIPNRYY